MSGIGHNSGAFGEDPCEVIECVLDDDTKKLFHYVQWHLADYITGTQGMSPEQEGVYIRFLVRLYDRGKPFPDDDKFMSSMMSLDVRRWRRVKSDLVSFGKISVRAGALTNSRFEKERQKRAAELRRQAEATQKYWERKRAEKETSDESRAEVEAKSVESPKEVREDFDEKPNKIKENPQHPTLETRDQRLEKKEEETSLRSVPDDAGLDSAQIVWGRGVEWLASASGVSAKKLRPLVGKWLKVLTFDELLSAMRSAAKAKTGDPIAYIGAFVASAKQAEHNVHRENGRIVVNNGFRIELETILEGRDLQRSLDLIAGKIPIGIVGIELETKVRSMAIEMVERVADQDRRYAAAAAEKTSQLTSAPRYRSLLSDAEPMRKLRPRCEVET